jgi:formiminotetrahydrofolate cyclodeaminase
MNKTEERLFEVNHFYEKLLDLRRTDPKAFNEMSPASKLSLYAYEAQKREHARLQAIRDEADAA